MESLCAVVTIPVVSCGFWELPSWWQRLGMCSQQGVSRVVLIGLPHHSDSLLDGHHDEGKPSRTEHEHAASSRRRIPLQVPSRRWKLVVHIGTQVQIDGLFPPGFIFISVSQSGAVERTTAQEILEVKRYFRSILPQI
jgi:hypothetical protein